jgi:extracellular factor (EF) 3-hydroxypalmitic acid methyl ester biosynthesis protein
MSNTSTAKVNGRAESLVSCQTSQGLDLRANLLHLTRFKAVFEVYSPVSVLRMSEVLEGFNILTYDQPVYSGRAVVSNLINAGSVLICEVSLQEGWHDVELMPLASHREHLHTGFSAFLREWEKTYRVRDDYKVLVADMQTFFTELRLWLEQVELAVRSLPTGDRMQAEREVVQKLQEPTGTALSQFFEKFEMIARGVEEELGPAHSAFCRRQLHPFLLSSPFMHRIYVKPLGYAGDYEMVNMILRDPCEGGSVFGKLLNMFILSQVPAVAHRNRVAYLTRKLIEESLRATQHSRKLAVLNLGCGPAMEVQAFLSQSELCERADFELLDFDDETLAHVGRCIEKIKRTHQRHTPVKLVKKSVHQLLKQAGKPLPAGQQYDMIYCAGLFDYLSDRTCKSLLSYFYDNLAPGGLLIATNVECQNPIRKIMEYMFEWHLIYRTGSNFAALAPEYLPPGAFRLETEASGGNVFLEIRKPPNEV